MRIAVCWPQVLFDHGGAEILCETLVDELRERGHEVEPVSIPFKWYPGARVLQDALTWRLIDVEESQGRPVDLVIATKFPSYAVRHPNKVVWLVHQFRQAYDFDRTDLGQFDESPFDRATVHGIERLDRNTLGEARRLFAISKNVADRLQRTTGLEAEVLPPPPQPLPYRSDGAGDFVLSVGRLRREKRVDLLLRAAAMDGRLRIVVAGEGPERESLESLASELGLDGRVRFAGRVDEQALVDLYAGCFAVFYAPLDEDYGFVPYEAFLSEKPVVTTSDAGGPLEVVSDRVSGVVCAPTPDDVSKALSWLV
ncbi:MAG: glycosyltransferase family 4 protein, partial [Actinomycetota bacterium]|nr:glycosyltransferase family 4 protein [Actinomycetota bacterium]